VERVTSNCIRALAGRSSRTQIKFIDGSAPVAFKAGQATGYPFSQMHLSDLEPHNSSTLSQRIKIGRIGDKLCRARAPGKASVVVDQVMGAINPYGLHLAFLDPFNLAELPFSIIDRMFAGTADGYDHPRQPAGLATQP
jgi:hypothetical protein